jgi:hypothetical protein
MHGSSLLRGFDIRRLVGTKSNWILVYQKLIMGARHNPHMSGIFLNGDRKDKGGSHCHKGSNMLLDKKHENPACRSR